MRSYSAGRSRSTLIGSVVALATVLSACSAAGGDSVVTMNGKSLVSRDQLEVDLAAFEKANLANIPKEQSDQLEQARARFHGSDLKKKTWSADYTAFMLQQHVIDEAFDAEFRSAKLKKSPLPSATKAAIVSEFGGEANYKLLSPALRASTEQRASQYDALLADSKAKLGSPEAFFKKNAAQFGTEVCASHILVATEAAAKAIVTSLADGGDFAEIAKKQSTDTGSGANGGELGCATPDTYVPEFAEATRTLEVGKVSDPVKTQFGYHVIKVTKRTEATYESQKAKVDELLSQQAGQEVSARVIARLKKAKITVDPEFGTVVEAGAQGYPEIQPKGAKPVAPGEIPPVG